MKKCDPKKCPSKKMHFGGVLVYMYTLGAEGAEIFFACIEVTDLRTPQNDPPPGGRGG